MKLLTNEKTETYHEIEVEYSFLWFKWRQKYRKVEDNVFRFKSPNIYHPTGFCEYIDVKSLFKIPIN